MFDHFYEFDYDILSADRTTSTIKYWTSSIITVIWRWNKCIRFFLLSWFLVKGQLLRMYLPWSRNLIRLQFYGGQLILALLNLSTTVAHSMHTVNQSNIMLPLHTQKSNAILFLFFFFLLIRQWMSTCAHFLLCMRKCECDEWACVCARTPHHRYMYNSAISYEMTVNAPTCNWLNTSKVTTISNACKCVFRLFFLVEFLLAHSQFSCNIGHIVDR